MVLEPLIEYCAHFQRVGNPTSFDVRGELRVSKGEHGSLVVSSLW